MHRIAVREVIAFVASVIRHDVMRKCLDAKPSIDTNIAIKELNLINMNLIGNSRYQVIHNQCKRQREIMRLLGITAENLDNIAAYETNRLNRRTVHPVQSLSPIEVATTGENHTSENKNSVSTADSKSSNKCDTELSDTESTRQDNLESTNKRRPGRPKGSKNKSKPIEQEETVVKRKPGRPKGSKNKPKQIEQVQVEKRRPGRPKGSKNKPKSTEPIQVEKRRPGRPKGSKNKPK
jgi:hypothetical protein